MIVPDELLFLAAVKLVVKAITESMIAELKQDDIAIAPSVNNDVSRTRLI